VRVQTRSKSGEEAGTAGSSSRPQHASPGCDTNAAYRTFEGDVVLHVRQAKPDGTFDLSTEDLARHHLVLLFRGALWIALGQQPGRRCPRSTPSCSKGRDCSLDAPGR